MHELQIIMGILQTCVVYFENACFDFECLDENMFPLQSRLDIYTNLKWFKISDWTLPTTII